MHHVMEPYWFGFSQDESTEEFGLRAAQSIADKIDELGSENVAAFIGEPVQGAGGVIIPPDSYWPAVQKILDERDVLLISDEVICGFGRLGEWFGSEYFDIEADLMPIAKGLSSGYLPIGGLMVGDRVTETVINKGSDFNHGFTYSGHPAACAVALENIRILKDEKIIEKAKNELSPYLQKNWLALGDHPIVGEARGIGMVGALELVKDKNTKTSYPSDQNVGTICRDFCFNNGLIMRAVGDAMIICPPLVISHSEINELIEKAKLCLDLTWEKINS